MVLVLVLVLVVVVVVVVVVVTVTHGQCDARPTTLDTSPAYAATRCVDPRRDGQAELTWVAGNMPGQLPIPALTWLVVEQLR